ncbi:MAG: type II toxin-antitoxin system HicB family antitoxin [Chloroflexi bacterium]|nr:type II toxin-antitoxin system HicB family antitoxin [Chloroflexota bacterium]
MKTIQLTVEIWQEGNMYIAYCHELDVSSAGNTPEEAKTNIREALDIFFEETSRKGTLRELLEEGGFELGPGQTSMPLVSRSHFRSIEDIRVPIPIG